MRSIFNVIAVLVYIFTSQVSHAQTSIENAAPLLKPEKFSQYISSFNGMEDENAINLIPNKDSWNWINANWPAFECPDRDIEKIYWYRCWTFRKNIKQMPGYLAITEFQSWNPVSSAVGHHVMEGRWISDPKYVDQAILYWLRGTDGKPNDVHRFSSWTTWAAYQRYLVNMDQKYLIDILDDATRDYAQWESERLTESGLFYQFDVRDAMEESITGSRVNKNLRPNTNSYMYGNAMAISAMAKLADKPDIAKTYQAKAEHLKKLVQDRLWDEKAQFFKVRTDKDTLSQAREAVGFVPWYFNLPDQGKGFEKAWDQLSDDAGFHAPFGLTTAERRHPFFRTHGSGHGCEWDGPVWPFATSQTLTALINLLNQSTTQTIGVSKNDFLHAMQTYAISHHRNGLPYLGEYLDEMTGEWLKGDNPRSRYYNHSTYIDLVITGIVGLRPRADSIVEINPLIPADRWPYFCLDRVRYHGCMLTILWDRDGSRYNKGSGLTVFADGQKICHSEKIERITGPLNESMLNPKK